MESQSKGMILLRWFAFLPSAFLGAWLVWLLIFFGNQFFMGMIGINSDSFLFRLYVEVMSNGAMGWAFVYTGSRIVPNNRKIVAYVLAVVAILIAGGAMLPAIVQQDWWAIIGIVAMAGGAGLIVYQVTEGEIDLDVHRLT